MSEQWISQNAHYVLLDDRAIVEDFGHVMARCAHLFHAAFKGALVRMPAYKR
jgi:hypothetical protein